MIYEMARDVGARMLARKFPVLVVYGPERMQRESYDPIIVIERDRGGSDGLAAASGQQRNPRKIMTRTLAVRASIYARSSLPGAMVQDHERECERLVDGLLVALFEWQTAERAGAVSVSGARYLSAADRNDVETWPGVVYELRFNVPRAVFAMTYEGEAKPTATILGIRSRTEVSAPGFDAETGCDNTNVKRISPGVAIETCSAFALSKRPTFGVAIETSSAFGVAVSKHVAAGVAIETSSAFALNVADDDVTPLTIMGANTLAWYRADLGVTLDGSAVSAWADQSGNGHDLTQGTGSAQPLHSASDATLNDQATITFDGSDDFLANASINLPAPGTTPTFIWMVLRQIAWVSNRYLCSAGTANTMHIIQFTATPNLRTNNTGTGIDSAAATVGSWFRTERLYTASASDRFKIGATSNGGASTGNADPAAGYVIGARETGASCASCAFAEIVISDVAPSAGQLADLDAYVTARYGAGLV